MSDTAKSIHHILSVFKSFSQFSGYKINWNKSALKHLNHLSVNSILPSFIPVITSLRYLGVDIFPSLDTIAEKIPGYM